MGPAHRQRYDRAATWQELAESRWPADRPSKLGPFKPYPGQHAAGGHGSVTRLFHQGKALGYDVVRAYLDRSRPHNAPLLQAAPTIREVTNWLYRRPDDLTEDEKPKLMAALDRCPELDATSAQVRAFATMITRLTGQDFPQWIATARDAGLPGIASFAKGLEHDIDAVTNGLTMNWSPGPVEGRVNHKMVKRQRSTARSTVTATSSSTARSTNSEQATPTRAARMNGARAAASPLPPAPLPAGSIAAAAAPTPTAGSW